MDSEKLQRPQLAEVPSRKKGGEGPYKGWEHHGNNQPPDKKWRTIGVVHRSEDGGVPFSPKTPTPETDSVMEDATRQEKKTRDFEAQLREIDCAIFAVDTDKESFEKRESAKENRAGPGFSPIDQPKAQTHGTGGKEINQKYKAQSPCIGLLTDPGDPQGCDRDQQEAQFTLSRMFQKKTEGGRALRSKIGEAILNDNIQATEIKIESLRQRTSTTKKRPEKKKIPENRGKENEPPPKAKTNQVQEKQHGVNQSTWKRFRREGKVAASSTVDGPEIGSKRKGEMPIKEALEETEPEKRSKKEAEVVLVGHLLAKHLGSAEVAVQPRRHQ